MMITVFAAVLLACSAMGERQAAARKTAPLDLEPPVGGENSPDPSDPPAFSIELAELTVGDGAVRVPTGEYTAPKGGAPLYSVPGPIAAFRGPDGTWRGHGYLETYPRLLKFRGATDEGGVTSLSYEFEGGGTYRAVLTVRDGVLLLEETSNLGPRNLFVLDCYYHWQPGAAFATDMAGTNHAFVYLPCYYDKPEVTIIPPALAGKVEDVEAQTQPAAIAVLSSEDKSKDVAGFWCRDVTKWEGADTMGIQLWQRRQLPGDPESRHFLGPETKSDSTPNPRTAGMLGDSLYEGHVTIELNLGVGTRKLGFAAVGKGDSHGSIPRAFKQVVKANQ